MTQWGLWPAVALGGAFGALLRALTYRWLAGRASRSDASVDRRFGLARATLFVNVAGSFLLGALVAALAEVPTEAPLRIFWVTGFCGSLTTFSTFCADTIRLARTQRRGALVGFLVGNGLLSVLGFSVGLGLARRWIVGA